MALEGVDNVKRGNGFALGVFSVGDSITDDRFQERLKDTTGLLVDHLMNQSVSFKSTRGCKRDHGFMRLTRRNTLDTTTTSETTNGGLRDTLDIVSQDLSVALSTALAETFTTLSTCKDIISVIETPR